MTRVDIIYKSLPSYRLDFFEGLRTALGRENVELRLTYGDPSRTESSKGDSRSLDWATSVPNRFVNVAGRQLIWQPVLGHLRGSDLIIAEQASKLLVNYPLLARHITGAGTPFAFWGHGENLQRHTASAVSEAMKRRYSRLPHWWFAYTEDSKSRVEALGYPAQRITVVQNAIDTAGLQAGIASVGADEIDRLLRSLAATRGHTAVFIGSLYSDKRLEFLIESARFAHQFDNKFTLLVAGDGPARGVIEDASSRYSFIHSVGRVDGRMREILLSASDVMLMPGLVGLAALDAFAGQTPMLTVAHNFHSPEVAYLVDGENSLIFPGHITARDYGRQVVRLLDDPERLASLRQGCDRAAAVYTVEAMVNNFTKGVLDALA